MATWLWGKKWNPIYAERLFDGLERHINQRFKTILITDQNINCGADIVYPIDVEEDADLLSRLGCLIRTRMFDRKFQEDVGMLKGDKVVCIDVDAVITGNLDPLFLRDDEFTIMQHFNSTNPCPFNGSLWMFRAGERHDVWADFTLESYHERRVPFHAIPDDQGWLHYKFPNAGSYTPVDGVYAFKKRTWPSRDLSLPANAKVVAFPGRDPNKYTNLEWVYRHWGNKI